MSDVIARVTETSKAIAYLPGLRTQPLVKQYKRTQWANNMEIIWVKEHVLSSQFEAPEGIWKQLALLIVFMSKKQWKPNDAAYFQLFCRN